MRPGWAALLALGCAGDAPPARTAPTTDDAPCAPGELRDGDQCVPEVCGVGPWGDLDLADFDAFVDPAAPPGGAGTHDDPVATLQDAFDLVGTTGHIAVAAGTVYGTGERRSHHDQVIAGRCAALVTAADDGRSETRVRAVFRVDAPGDRLTLRGLRITGGRSTGVSVDAGEVVLEDVVLEDNRNQNLRVVGAEARATLRGVTIANPTLEREDSWSGVLVLAGAVVDGTDVVVEPHAESSVVVDDATLTLTGSVLRGPAEPNTDYYPTVAVHLTGQFTCEDCVLEDVTGVAVATWDLHTQATLDRTTIRGVSAGVGVSGIGIEALSSSVVVASDLTFEDVSGSAVVAAELAEVVLTDATVRDLSSITPVVALAARDAGQIAVDGLVAERVEGWVATAMEPGSHVSLADVALVEVGVGDLATTDWVSGVAEGGGVVASAEGRVTVDGLTAVDLMGPALLARDATIEAVDLDVDGIVPLYPTEVDGVRAGPAIISGPGADVVVRDSRVAGATAVATAALGGALQLDGVTLAGTRPATAAALGLDLLVRDGGVASVTGTRFVSAEAHGVQVVDPGSAATLADVALEPSAGHGLVGSGGVDLDLSDVQVTGRTGLGVVVDGDGSTLSAVDLAVDGTADGPRASLGVGVGVLDGATAALTRLSSNGDAGVSLFSDQATASCSGCLIEDAELVAVYARGGALALDGGAITATRPVDGVGGFGLVVDAAGGVPEITLDDVAITDHPTVGTWLRGAGDYRITGGVLGGGPAWPTRGGRHVHGDALVLSEGADRVTLSGTRVEGADGVGLLLHGATAVLDGARFSGNTVDVVQQGCDAGAPAPVVVDAGVTLDHCPASDRLLLSPELGFFVDLAGAASE